MASTAFRVLWFAQLGSNIGGWMQTVGAQWFLVEASAGPTVIALVQTASLAPAVLLSLLAGVLADSYDRRRLLIAGSVASAVLAGALAAISATGALTAVLLLGFTFLLGVSSTLTSPAWQAIQPELVPREQIGASAALGGLTVNGARAIGPALAGVVLSAFGAPVVFGINALSFIVAVAALLWWKRPPQAGLEDREHFGPALAAGLRYVASAHLVRRILLRSALFALPASALWALLPLTATRLHLGSSGYGLLLTGPGVGAVLGIVLLPAARRRLSDNWIIAISALLYAAGAAAAASLPLVPTLLLLVLAGIAWIGTLTVLNTALQLTLPQWVRSRGAATYILVFMGTMAVGSVLWGALASAIGTPLALTVSAVMLALVAVSVLRLPLLPGTGVIDRSARLAWDSPTLLFEPAPSDGPVLITVAYTVRAASRHEFQEAMTALGASRRRTGAFRWRLYRSGEEEDVRLETFMLPSWSEYRRQQTQRSTGRDREIEARALAACEGAPRWHHYFAGETDDTGAGGAPDDTGETGAPVVPDTGAPTPPSPHQPTTKENPHA